MNVDKFIRETLANKIEEIRKTILHPDNEPNVTLYPKTSIDQVEQLTEQLDYIKTGLIKDTLMGKDGIVIYKAADSEKIEVSGKNLIKNPHPGVNITGAGIVTYKPLGSSDWGTAFIRNSHSLVDHAEYGAIVGYDDGGVIYAKTTTDDPWSVVNKKYVDDAIASISSTTQTKYQHIIKLEGTKDGFTFTAFMSLMRPDDTAITSLDEVISILRSASHSCTGYLYDGNQKSYNVIAFEGSGSVFVYNDPEAGGQVFEVTANDVEITDNVLHSKI